jgi:hypothetical protein
VLTAAHAGERERGPPKAGESGWFGLDGVGHIENIHRGTIEAQDGDWSGYTCCFELLFACRPQMLPPAVVKGEGGKEVGDNRSGCAEAKVLFPRFEYLIR